MRAKHRPDGGPFGADRCVCGAEIVFFEPLTWQEWAPGYGCEVLGRPTLAFEDVR